MKSQISCFQLLCYFIGRRKAEAVHSLLTFFSLFSGNSMEEIVTKLKQDGSPFAIKQLEVMLSL